MADPLDTLAEREKNLEDQVLKNFRAGGEFRIVEQKLGDLGIFNEYSEIHKEYAKLARNGNDEALKRALFLQWFEFAEPTFLTGIYQLDKKVRDLVFKIIEQKYRTDDIDPELKWMVPYYYQIGPYFHEKDYPEFTLFSKANPPSKNNPVPPKDAQFSGRGLMGRYWQSIKSNKWKTETDASVFMNFSMFHI
jgi:hypothetical protein